MNQRNSFFRSIFGELFFCTLSSILLTASFLPYRHFSFLAWIALVPFLIAIHHKSKKRSFFLGWFCGFLFFLGSMHWFFYLANWFGWIAVVGVVLFFIYLGLYLGLFGIVNSLLSEKNILLKNIGLACGWIVLEYIRAKLFSGFDWGSLGHTQYRELPLIQMADITGVFGISFLIILVNLYFKEIFILTVNQDGKPVSKKYLTRLGLIVWTFLCLTVLYGYCRLHQSWEGKEKLRVSVIQGNISQDQKWAEITWPNLLMKHMALTQNALASKPDLIIWPETSVPGIYEMNDPMWQKLSDFVRDIKVPVLVGLIEKDRDDYYNSAFLISADGKVAAKYRKMHLVPFGEFFPFRSILGSVADMLDIGDFTSGKNFTKFSLNATDNKFSVLICFEDTLSALARKFVQQGSGLFINMTNDAWFGDTYASVMHLQNAVFRTVENRRTLIRAANTGLSCFIDAKGNIRKVVQDQMRKATFVEGISTDTVYFSEGKTFYTKYGDVFAYLCFVCILGIGLVKRVSIK